MPTVTPDDIESLRRDVVQAYLDLSVLLRPAEEAGEEDLTQAVLDALGALHPVVKP